MTTVPADVPGDMDARVGRLVHQMMWDQRLTQTGVAARLGIQQSALSKKLRGERHWSLWELRVMAKILNTTSAYLLGETDDPNRPAGDDGPPDDGGDRLPRLDSNQQPFGDRLGTRERWWPLLAVA